MLKDSDKDTFAKISSLRSWSQKPQRKRSSNAKDGLPSARQGVFWAEQDKMCFF